MVVRYGILQKAGDQTNKRIEPRPRPNRSARSWHSCEICSFYRSAIVHIGRSALRIRKGRCTVVPGWACAGLSLRSLPLSLILSLHFFLLSTITTPPTPHSPPSSHFFFPHSLPLPWFQHARYYRPTSHSLVSWGFHITSPSLSSSRSFLLLQRFAPSDHE
jgi:hypothetical protein